MLCWVTNEQDYCVCTHKFSASLSDVKLLANYQRNITKMSQKYVEALLTHVTKEQTLNKSKPQVVLKINF